MDELVISIEQDGKQVLAFDTGLNPQDFARARMTLLLTQSGSIVYPDGRIEAWQPGGVIELPSEKESTTMAIWGPHFPGERLDGIINTPGRQDEALDAIRFWLRARIALERRFAEQNPPEHRPGSRKTDDEKNAPFPGPAGAFILSEKELLDGQNPYPAGTVFFPPSRLMRRSLEANGPEAILEAKRWVHPDREGAEGISFSAGVMLYRVFCGAPPFPGDDEAKLRQDIREGVFTPPALATPGLDPEMASLISRSMGVTGRNNEPKALPDYVDGFIGPPASRQVSSWIKRLSNEEIAKIGMEREQYSRKKEFSVKTRRFVIRNTVIITVCCIAVIVLLFSIRGFIRHRAELPSTRGMISVEVVRAYYDAFGELDHPMMEACVSGKAGSEDINMVMNLFVISKVRQAYEGYTANIMSAREWIESGRPATAGSVFGITDLVIRPLNDDGESAGFEANYILWTPGEHSEEENPSPDEQAMIMPNRMVSKDILYLKFQKGVWKITEINRQISL